MTNSVTRQIRRLARSIDDEARKVETAERKTNGLRLRLSQENGKPEPDAAAIESLQDEIIAATDDLNDLQDELQDAASRVLNEQLALLLVDEEGKPPEPDFLAEHLDTRDAGPLMEWLMTDGEGGNSSTPSEPATTATTT